MGCMMFLYDVPPVQWFMPVEQFQKAVFSVCQFTTGIMPNAVGNWNWENAGVGKAWHQPPPAMGIIGPQGNKPACPVLLLLFHLSQQNATGR